VGKAPVTVFQRMNDNTFTVGSIGIDRTGPNYSDREFKVVSIDTPGDKVIVEYTDGSQRTFAFQAKREMTKNILREIALKAEIEQRKRPGFLSIDKLVWDSEGNLARFLGYLVGPGQVHFYLEAPPKYDDVVVNHYHSLTGETIVPTKGLYNIAPEAKWAVEVNIHFIPTDNIPDSIALQQTERVGLISRHQMFWALVEHGFTLRSPQDPDKIRTFIPDSQKVFFDEGLKK